MKTLHHFRFAVLVMALLPAPKTALAHCDTLDGPVVQTAKAALAKRDITPVLKWVKADDEPAIRTAFIRTLDVRKLSPAAAELADLSFFETLVRVHRAGEGEPYTGLQPAGSAEPALAAADRAIENDTVDHLAADLAARVQNTLRQRFAQVIERKAHMNDSVTAGRSYIEAYVIFIHLYERLATETDPAAKPAGHVH